MKSIIRSFVMIGLVLVGSLAPQGMQAAQLSVSSTAFTQSDATPLANSPRMKKRRWHRSVRKAGDEGPSLGTLSLGFGVAGFTVTILSLFVGFTLLNFFLSFSILLVGLSFGLIALLRSKGKDNIDRRPAIAGIIVSAIPIVLFLALLVVAWFNTPF